MLLRRITRWTAACLALRASAQSLLDISITELQALLDGGALTSHELVRLYARRIAEVNDELHAVIETNPDALATARARDAERAAGHVRGPLHGIPILVKDNYATADAMRTGAGSVCLARSRPEADATVVAKLRAAGAVILGKTSLSEFSGARGANITQGWSARGGQTTGAYVENQTACGSSSGSGVAASLGLAAGTLGTETAGSIICPASANNVVGIKPTVGLTSRFGVVPITPRQDTTGPIAQSVADAALLLEVMAGKDPRDNYTSAQPWDAPPRYTSALNASALQGKRIGVAWNDEALFDIPMFTANREQTKAVFDAALPYLAAAGAELVPVHLGPRNQSLRDFVAAHARDIQAYQAPDLKQSLARYYDTVTPDHANATRDLRELVACLQATPSELASRYNTYGLEAALGTNESAGGAAAWTGYARASAASRRVVVGPLAAHGLDALVTVMEASHALAAAAGLPVVTVPMGALGPGARPARDRTGVLVDSAPGFPLGLSFVADRWSEMDLVGYAYAFEQAARKRQVLTPYLAPMTDLHSLWNEDRTLELKSRWEKGLPVGERAPPRARLHLDMGSRRPHIWARTCRRNGRDIGEGYCASKSSHKKSLLANSCAQLRKAAAATATDRVTLLAAPGVRRGNVTVAPLTIPRVLTDREATNKPKTTPSNKPAGHSHPEADTRQGRGRS